MAISIRHAFVSSKPQGSDPSVVSTNEWNADLNTSLATGHLVGRGTAGTGSFEEITLGAGLSFTGTTLNGLIAGSYGSLTSANLVYPSGQIILEMDTRGMKVGDGTTSYSSLLYWIAQATAPTDPPANTVLPTISGTAQDGQTLTCSTGTWTNSPTSYAYQWKRGGTTNIGTNSSTYLVITADVGSTLTCTVTASNTGGPGTPVTTNPTSTVIAAGGGGGADSRGRYGVGSATAGVSSPAALLSSMTVISGATNGSITTTGFTISPSGGNYGWAAFEATASAGGVTFTDALGTGGWQGASSSGDNGADDGSSPNTSTVTYDDGTTVWRFFRESYADAADTITATA